MEQAGMHVEVVDEKEDWGLWWWLCGLLEGLNKPLLLADHNIEVGSKEENSNKVSYIE